jgi:hypothetical protein
METILFMMAGMAVMFCLGLLVGSGLHTRSIDRRCRHVAQLVRSLNESGIVIEGKPAKRRSKPAHNPAAAWQSPRTEEAGHYRRRT